MADEDFDWSGVEPEVTDFVFLQAERYLESQLQSGLAADSRAITASSILVGLATAALTGAAGLILSNGSATAYLSAFVLGLGFSLAACMCFLAGKPINFFPPGNHPKQWYGALFEPLNNSKGAEIENYQEMIIDNETALDDSAKWLSRGIKVAILSPLAALVSFLVVIAFSL